MSDAKSIFSKCQLCKILDKFWSKKGAKMGAKLSIDFALKFEVILERKSRLGKIKNSEQFIFFDR